MEDIFVFGYRLIGAIRLFWMHVDPSVERNTDPLLVKKLGSWTFAPWSLDLDFIVAT